MQCPKCGEKMEWKYETEAKTLIHEVAVDVTFSIICPICEWSTEVSMTNSLSQEELNEIYLTESENGD
ncbi:MAG: hypothetical protein ACFFDT_22010 [Candidatus Hodarchaeota archaeon]